MFGMWMIIGLGIDSLCQVPSLPWLSALYMEFTLGFFRYSFHWYSWFMYYVHLGIGSGKLIIWCMHGTMGDGTLDFLNWKSFQFLLKFDERVMSSNNFKQLRSQLELQHNHFGLHSFHFDSIRSVLSILVLICPFSLILSTTVLFGPLWLYSVQFGPY